MEESPAPKAGESYVGFEVCYVCCLSHDKRISMGKLFKEEISRPRKARGSFMGLEAGAIAGGWKAQRLLIRSLWLMWELKMGRRWGNLPKVRNLRKV